MQHAKKEVSDGWALVDFAMGLVNSVFNLPDGQVMFFEEFSAALTLFLLDFMHKTLKERQKECIRRVVCLKEVILAKDLAEKMKNSSPNQQSADC